MNSHDFADYLRGSLREDTLGDSPIYTVDEETTVPVPSDNSYASCIPEHQRPVYFNLRVVEKELEDSVVLGKYRVTVERIDTETVKFD
jgi:hypothetical protein